MRVGLGNLAIRAADVLRPGTWLGWVAGPILDRELRSASRRRRTFVLRSGYLLALAGCVLLVGAVSAPRLESLPVYRAYRMAELGKTLVLTIVWFQFCALQLVAMVMLAGSVGEEVRRRTLGVLMVTPVTALQIVVGKLGSGLLQILLLVALSVPALVVIRVLGGVPGEFLAAGVCLTLATVVLVALVSVFFAARDPRFHMVLLKTLAALAAVFGLLPWGAAVVLEPRWGWGATQSAAMAVMHAHPYAALARATDVLLSPRGGPAFSWPVACLVVLGMDAVLLGACVWRLRRAALAQAVSGGEAGGRRARAGRASASVRRVGGSPVLWKELRGGRGRRRRRAIIEVGLALAGLLVTYWLLGRDLRDDDVHIAYHLILLAFGTMATAVLAATAIPAEKEAQTWLMLVATPLASAQIVAGKAAGVLRRSLGAWLLLAVHVVLFAALAMAYPAVPVHMVLIAAGAAVFVTGTGLYLGVRCRRTTTAVILNLAVPVVLWGVVPAGVALTEAFLLPVPLFEKQGRLTEGTLCFHPVVQTLVVSRDLTGGGDWQARGASAGPAHRGPAHRGPQYRWPEPLGLLGLAGSTLVVLLSATAHGAVGVFFAAQAAMTLRGRAA